MFVGEPGGKFQRAASAHEYIARCIDAHRAQADVVVSLNVALTFSRLLPCRVTMFTVSGAPIKVSAQSVARSKVLTECMETSARSNAARAVDIPLARKWVEAWDSELPVKHMDLEELIGIAKVQTLKF